MVTLSRMDLLVAQRLLQLLLVPDGQSPDSRGRNSAAPRDRALLVARAQTEFLDRRRRIAVFGQSMFGEAAWDMLLALYILDTSGQRPTVGSLIEFAGTPATTAKRWLDYLMAHDLVRREPHPTDRRTAFVSLTSKAREKLDLYYAETSVTAV
jgi:DNA-binding MarR family transcriptional regulator